jgi:hypothetical protein
VKTSIVLAVGLHPRGEPAITRDSGSAVEGPAVRQAVGRWPGRSAWPARQPGSPSAAPRKRRRGHEPSMGALLRRGPPGKPGGRLSSLRPRPCWIRRRRRLRRPRGSSSAGPTPAAPGGRTGPAPYRASGPEERHGRAGRPPPCPLPPMSLPVTLCSKSTVRPSCLNRARRRPYRPAGPTLSSRAARHGHQADGEFLVPSVCRSGDCWVRPHLSAVA